MDDLYNCIRIMQISTEKLQSTRYCESLHRTSLIRLTFLQSHKQFCDLLYSCMKVTSRKNTFLPIVIQNDNRKQFLSHEQSTVSVNRSSKKRKSSYTDENVKRSQLTSSPSNLTRNEKQCYE